MRKSERRPLLEADEDLVLVEAETSNQSPNNNNNNNMNDSSQSRDNCDSGTDRQIGGAAVAGGLAGLILAGPLIGLVAAGGAAVVACTDKGKAGQVVRACGDATVDAGHRIRKWDEKHHVGEKVSHGFTEGCRWVSKKLEPKHTPQSNLTA